MKIAFIINSLSGGGAERVVQTLSNYLIASNEIFIILLEDAQQDYTIDNRVKIITLKTSKIAKGIGKIIFIPLQSYELNKLLTKLKIDNAISFLVRSNLVFSFTTYFNKRKIIISERNYSTIQYLDNSIKNNTMNFLIKFLYKKANKIISISNGIKTSLVSDYSLIDENINTIYNPQDINYIKNYKLENIDYKFEKDIQYFITLGRLIPQKDHETMIKAFKKVNDKNKNTKLLILGEGNLRKPLEILIKELDLENSVVLLGFINNPFDYLKRADVFVFSSIFEGFGNALVEAMACGLPTISTTCPSGPSEILNNGEYGMLVHFGNIDQLSDAMLSMLEEQNMDKFKEKSFQRANDFDIAIISKEYLNILEGKL